MSTFSKTLLFCGLLGIGTESSNAQQPSRYVEVVGPIEISKRTEAYGDLNINLQMVCNQLGFASAIKRFSILLPHRSTKDIEVYQVFITCSS